MPLIKLLINPMPFYSNRLVYKLDYSFNIKIYLFLIRYSLLIKNFI